MTAFGPIHKLVVHEVGEPYGPLSTEEFTDFEVHCPPECATKDKCAVMWNIETGGARWMLKYAGCPVDEPGEYLIQAWAERYRGYDYVEYDGGIGLVTNDDATPQQAADVRSAAAERAPVDQLCLDAGQVDGTALSWRVAE
jgi:hypothetical protein